ncbi:transmembrane emp24 domain-containing protein 11 isoform X1 [Panthera pardus]|uniref:Transmembrane emp24 domain-containing protein 11 isoform X1 n=1 Tax=Panthera pardus TaxID=9691 RepID=A0A9V1EZT1_PANPR|nr:transmembrane emp24 domain-containing protein 11 isoform X1 [Panthera pardus]
MGKGGNGDRSKLPEKGGGGLTKRGHPNRSETQAARVSSGGVKTLGGGQTETLTIPIREAGAGVPEVGREEDGAHLTEWEARETDFQVVTLWKVVRLPGRVLPPPPPPPNPNTQLLPQRCLPDRALGFLAPVGESSVLLSKLYGPQGTFYFTSHSPGEHIICLESNSTRLVSFGGSKLRIHLEIRVGQHDLDAAAAQAKDKVNEVSFKLERLIEQIEQIVKEQNYQRDREENFRMTSEDTNSDVLWWAFAQTLIFIAIGIFQMKHLKDFFIAKKLV